MPNLLAAQASSANTRSSNQLGNLDVNCTGQKLVSQTAAYDDDCADRDSGAFVEFVELLFSLHTESRELRMPLFRRVYCIGLCSAWSTGLYCTTVAAFFFPLFTSYLPLLNRHVRCSTMIRHGTLGYKWDARRRMFRCLHFLQVKQRGREARSPLGFPGIPWD